MLFSSTSKNYKDINLKEAVLSGIAPDKSLYIPNSIERLPTIFFQDFVDYEMPEISSYILTHFFKNDLNPTTINKISQESFNFEIPLIELNKNLSILELFHGPTLAFKDVGARFMSSLFENFNENKETIILTATSGDTGSAVANAFYRKKNVKVIVLYPKGKVSNVQEKQFTTLGENIVAVEVSGTFDDCQKLVKDSFLNIDLKSKFNLTSANSINVARLLPQSFYYFKGYAAAVKAGVIKNGDLLTYSVPSGNLGNLTGGILAKEMGLPIKFLVATNINKTFFDFIKTQEFQPRNSIETISSAMDVGNPSNFERLYELISKKNKTNNNQQIINDLCQFLTPYYFNDEDTAKNIVDIWNEYNYLIDPHTSVGVLAAKNFPSAEPVIVLSTAHPAKFPETVKNSFQKYNHNKEIKINIPERLQVFLNKEKVSLQISPNLNELEQIIYQIS